MLSIYIYCLNVVFNQLHNCSILFFILLGFKFSVAYLGGAYGSVIFFFLRMRRLMLFGANGHSWLLYHIIVGFCLDL